MQQLEYSLVEQLQMSYYNDAVLCDRIESFVKDFRYFNWIKAHSESSIARNSRVQKSISRAQRLLFAISVRERTPESLSEEIKSMPNLDSSVLASCEKGFRGLC